MYSVWQRDTALFFHVDGGFGWFGGFFFFLFGFGFFGEFFYIELRIRY